jgi:hypothetical protein
MCVGGWHVAHGVAVSQRVVWREQGLAVFHYSGTMWPWAHGAGQQHRCSIRVRRSNNEAAVQQQCVTAAVQVCRRPPGEELVQQRLSARRRSRCGHGHPALGPAPGGALLLGCAGGCPGVRVQLACSDAEGKMLYRGIAAVAPAGGEHAGALPRVQMLEQHV